MKKKKSHSDLDLLLRRIKRRERDKAPMNHAQFDRLFQRWAKDTGWRV